MYATFHMDLLKKNTLSKVLFFSSTFVSQVSFALCLHVCMRIRDDWFTWCKLATPVSLLFLFPTFFLLNVLMPVTSSTLIHVGFGNHTRATTRLLKKRTRQQLPVPPLWEITWVRQGRMKLALCGYVCVNVCVILVLTSILMSLMNAINSLTWMEVWTSFTHIMWSTA